MFASAFGFFNDINQRSKCTILSTYPTYFIMLIGSPLSAPLPLIMINNSNTHPSALLKSFPVPSGKIANGGCLSFHSGIYPDLI